MSECSVWAASAAGSSPVARGNGLRDGSVSDDAAPSSTLSTVVAPPLQSAATAPRARHKRPSDKQPDPAKVLSAFNTWAFKREQPADPQLMLQLVAESIAVGAPISFVLYWGKGPRCRIGQPDIECLDYLAAFARRVGEAYEPGAAIKLIFTDTHAELNGHSPQTLRSYFHDIADAARQRGFDTCWLGALTRAAGAAAADAIDDASPDMLGQLADSAKKWYRGEGTPEDGARKYFRMNMIERRAVELAFPRSIFVTFNAGKLRELFPQRLPIFYMYSLRRGVAVKPWFLPGDATLCSEAACHCAAAPAQQN
jgi:hypothetical protein